MLQCVAVSSIVFEYVFILGILFAHVNGVALHVRAAVCCSVLQSVAVCCSVLQSDAMCCSALQCVATCCSVLQGGVACCSVLKCTAMCLGCDVLEVGSWEGMSGVCQRVAVC